MNVDETPNSPDANPGGVCPYFSTENGCSDRITWSNQFSDNTFTVGRNSYQLNLVGFSETMDLSTITEQFISQEGMSSDAHIFARIDQVDNPAQDVPEPTAMLGFGLMGWAIARSRRTSEAS